MAEEPSGWRSSLATMLDKLGMCVVKCVHVGFFDSSCFSLLMPELLPCRWCRPGVALGVSRLPGAAVGGVAVLPLPAAEGPVML